MTSNIWASYWAIVVADVTHAKKEAIIRIYLRFILLLLGFGFLFFIMVKILVVLWICCDFDFQ